MLTRIDHVIICVPDLVHAIRQYARMGFNIAPDGTQAGKGTHNAIGGQHRAARD